MRRPIVFIAAIAALALVAIIAIGVRNGRADPVRRTAAIALPDWPPGAAPVRVMLLSGAPIARGSNAWWRKSRRRGPIWC